MSFEIVTDKGLVFATVSGPWCREEAEQMQTEVVAALRRRSCYGLLLDLSKADIAVNTMDMFEVTASHADLFPVHFKHAVVVPALGLSSADAQFCQDVAMNRGVKMRIFFDDREAALRWLGPEA